MYTRLIYLLMLVAFCMPIRTMACTTVLVSAKASATGRPLMWKHRDANVDNNFIERVEAINGHMGYVALFDAGDTRLIQAWMGMNDAGFAIMNSASYNLQPDTARVKDLEGALMTLALRDCRTVKDFEDMLGRIKKPMGVQANFGVMDANGGLAYFEVNDHTYRRFDVSDSPDGYLIRTNFSQSGTKGEGKGYLRYGAINELIKAEIEAGNLLSPEFFTEKASRSYYHSLYQKDMLKSEESWIVDQDFIPRYISTASIAIEGINRGQSVKDMIMWAALGFPPCSVAMPVTTSVVPNELRPTAEGYRSPLCDMVQQLKKRVFPIALDGGGKYINLQVLRAIIEQSSASSKNNYDKIYNRTQPSK